MRKILWISVALLFSLHFTACDDELEGSDVMVIRLALSPEYLSAR